MNACMDSGEGENAMPLHEKRAWLGLATTAVVYGAFLAEMLATPADQLTLFRFMMAFTVAITIQSVILAIGHSIFAVRDPDAVKAPLDERDLLVARRSTRAADGTLMSVVFILGIALPYYAAAGWQITLAAIMAMVAADMVRSLAIVVNYRRNG